MNKRIARLPASRNSVSTLLQRTNQHIGIGRIRNGGNLHHHARSRRSLDSGWDRIWSRVCPSWYRSLQRDRLRLS